MTDGRDPRAARIHVGDALRGVAAFAVCWFHFTNGNPAFLDDGLLKASGAHGWIGWEVFFVLSGFVVPYSLWRANYRPRDAGAYLAKRLLRLYPPYVASIALGIAVAVVAANLPGYRGQPFTFDAPRILSNLVYLNSFFDYASLNPVYWSLAIEVQFYVLVAVVMVPLTSGVSAQIATLLALVALRFAIPDPRLVFTYLPLFALGMIAFHYRSGLAGGRRTAMLAIAMLLLLIYVQSPIEAAVALATAALLMLTPNAGRARSLQWLGAISYSLYLVHIPLGGRIINLGEQLQLPGWAKLVFLIVAVAASLAAAALFHRLVEAPSVRLARTVGDSLPRTSRIVVEPSPFAS